MARIDKGILGGIKGKIGNVFGYYYKDIPVIKCKPRRSKKAQTEEQLATLQRMEMTNVFLKMITKFVGLGFSVTEIGKRSNGYNAAKSFITKNCFDGEYPNQILNYSKVKVTEGDLPQAINPQMTSFGDDVKVTWETDPKWSFAERRSEAMVLVYCPALNRSSYYSTGERKAKGEELLPVPKDFKGQEVHGYLGFIADDRKNIATSVYLGSIIL